MVYQVHRIQSKFAGSVWQDGTGYFMRKSEEYINGCMPSGSCVQQEDQDTVAFETEILIREMHIEDYSQVHALWMTIRGFGIRSLDDSREGVERFIRRNPSTSVVALAHDSIVGAILCGHDGRRGCFYHVCVHEDYRKKGIGKAMAVFAMKALQKEQINKVSLIAFKSNEVGNRFWRSVGWTFREDLNYYDFILNDANITKFNK